MRAGAAWKSSCNQSASLHDFCQASAQLACILSQIAFCVRRCASVLIPRSKHLYLTTWNKVLKSVIQKMAADGNELWRERVQFSKSELNNVSILQEIILRPPSFCGDQAVAHGPLVHGPRSMY